MLAIGLDGKSSISPKQVDASKHFYDAFRNNETECSAHYIVLLCQQKNGWFPFTEEEINSIYTRLGPGDGFWFNNLIPSGWIQKEDEKYYITQDFIDRVYKSSPANWWQAFICIIKSAIYRVRQK
jgi:hypothetical protein